MKEIIIFGEVLFDCFPDGVEIIGGAPFNVSWNLVGFGIETRFVSRIGNDIRGRKVLNLMGSWGMRVDAVQCDVSLPTGVVNVEYTEQGHRFVIPPLQAYDKIDGEIIVESLFDTDTNYVYHGSHCLRDPVSRDAFEELFLSRTAHNFFDVNLRKPWWTVDLVERLLILSRVVKVSDIELFVLTGSPFTADVKIERLIRRAKLFQEQFNIDLLCVTAGAQGAMVFRYGEKPILQHGLAPDVFVDAVGAGDAFTSVIILGHLLEWPDDVTLSRAIQFAGAVCGLKGATVNDKAFYQGFMDNWNMQDSGLVPDTGHFRGKN